MSARTIILSINDFNKKHGRIPLKKEFSHPNAARKRFGTWNNAIEATGFDTNPVLFAKHQVAKDGHMCDSIAEMIIDNYLFNNGILHERNYPYPEGTYTFDFKIGEKFIEYFGLAGEHKRYDELRDIKQKMAKKYKLNLVEIYPKDLYPNDRLGQILEISFS